MKRYSFLLITLIIFTNVCYASFPVTDIEQTEVIEYDSINHFPVIFIGILVGILSGIALPLTFFLAPIFLNLKDIQWREIIGYYLDFYKDLYDPNLSLKDRSFRTSFIIGYRIGIIIVAIYVIWFLYWLYRGITLGDWS
ncbi:MAG: hypothetical protein P8J34_05195 [Flavobacteriales bacterium]|jgi:hypothetical protein|nr:hypothetical protein [Flavobacteriales bacterium]